MKYLFQLLAWPGYFFFRFLAFIGGLLWTLNPREAWKMSELNEPGEEPLQDFAQTIVFLFILIFWFLVFRGRIRIYGH